VQHYIWLMLDRSLEWAHMPQTDIMLYLVINAEVCNIIDINIKCWVLSDMLSRRALATSTRYK